LQTARHESAQPTTPRHADRRPEHHSIHHELGVHAFNYGDITLWDRLFGTFKDTDTFAPRCGFPAHGEQELAAMLRFRDVYEARAGH
jgi:sterol desaturase/sphingolipid hydroxylase (fatty acid hydroxylase superfamily)